MQLIPTGSRGSRRGQPSIEPQEPPLEGLALRKSGQAGMIRTRWSGFETRDRAMSTTRRSLQDSIETERWPASILRDEQNPTAVQSLDTATQ